MGRHTEEGKVMSKFLALLGSRLTQNLWMV